MKVFNTALALETEECLQFSDVTKPVQDAVQGAGITGGFALVSTPHTTCALFLNEFQGALIDDVRAVVERLVPEAGGYRHDDARYSDCERGNGAAHLRAVLLGRSVVVGVARGELALGRFQSIIFAELDGPRKREVTVQVIGE